ncbi:MAG: chemotaxis response regulator protein-glutamate methylesterase [Syntrophomonadaceae bacterium]|nr:chemotaxis response regulator protein-glutamate methylesterase [Syntrophomonadaceae bacterium]MDD3888623.1 chemotaxis response regulator protein-glutamate methylesterase [Syntrophomonadaceae bacterium]MDD4548246.1 chemotaxis response regulator protein-glutamate methylesterase [Syntrophomonadaceae bacterium]
MSKVKVLVVDDSAFMRKIISDIINSQSDLQVIGRAKDGKDALKKIKELQPDVVTLDIEMPEMDGLTTLEQIIKDHPVPVIMISSLTKNGADRTMKALQLGAVDFITKPSGQISLDIEQVSDDITRKIQAAAGTKKRLQNVTNISQLSNKETNNSKIEKNNRPELLKNLVLIGTSTGGPKALHQVIPGLPADINAAILIVQHMPPGFTRSLAERLNSISEIHVKEAEHGEEIRPGCAYIAPGDYHLTVITKKVIGQQKLLVHLDKSEQRGGHRPSVDVMLESAADQFWGHMVCVIMTGMGHDGAVGLVDIKNKSGAAIAEHQSTCIVYGMPRAAVATGRVDKIVPLPAISDEILKML